MNDKTLRRAARQRVAPAALALALAMLAAGSASLHAAPGDRPVAPLPPGAAVDNKANVRSAQLPARGLFVGDQLSDATKARLTELIVEAIGLQVQVALLVPTGPWQIDGAGHTDRDLNQARLASLRKFLVDRGIEQKRIIVESRIDSRLKEPRLDVQLIGTPGKGE